MEKMEVSTVANIAGDIELLDFPDEVLLNIMVHLNDTTLLNMTRVCKRFKTIAKEAFSKKYSGKTNDQYFTVKLFYENLIVERKQYQSLFSTFGENMVAIDIWFTHGPVARDHWILAMMQRFCSKLSKIEIGGGEEIDLLKVFRSLPNLLLTHLCLANTAISNTNWSKYRYPNLIQLYVNELYEYDQQKIIDFISTNTQLQEIHLQNLEIDNYVPIVEAIENNCKNIHKLEILEWNENILWNSEMINTLSNLTTLNVLKIDAHGLKLSQLGTLVRRLSNLSVLSLETTSVGSEIYENLTRAVSICRYTSKLKIRTKDPSFSKLNFELLTHIADEVMQSNKTVVLKDYIDTIVIVKGEVRRNKIIVYKHDAICSRSAANFLDLNDDCLAKIVKCLTPKEHCALYDTCKRTRTRIENFYSEIEFHASFTSKILNESFLWCLGKQIRLMHLGHYWFTTRNEFEELWRRINQYCTNLNELTIMTGNNLTGEDYTIQADCEWPTLRKLKFSAMFDNCKHNEPSSYSVSYEILRSFFCPSLTHLEVLSLRIDDNTPGTLDHGDHFRHLTVLKFGYYNQSVKKFLLALDDNVCEQMQELSIGSQLIMSTSDPDDDTDVETIDSEPSRLVVELVNIVPRFPKLTTLQLIVPGVDQCNTKYLFEKCTYLVHFGVWCNGENQSDELLDHMLDNCMHIRTIRLFGHGIYRTLLQKIRQMFPHVSIEVALQDHIAFSVADRDPHYSELNMCIPEPKY